MTMRSAGPLDSNLNEPRTGATRGTWPYLVFLAGVVAVSLFFVVRGIGMTLFYAELMERGVVTQATVISDELRPGSRHRGMVRYVGYTYEDSAGREYTGTASLKSQTDAGINKVTYLPDEPDRHVPFRMSPERVYRPVRDAALFMLVAVGLTLLFGFGIRHLI